MVTLESRIAELERQMELVSEKVSGLAKVFLTIASTVSEMRKSGYSALQDPPAGDRPARDTGVPVRQFDEKVVPAIQELQQLYTLLAEHLQAENFQDRVMGLEERVSELEEGMDPGEQADAICRDAKQFSQVRMREIEADVLQQVHTIKVRMDATDHVVNEMWDKVEALQGREDEQAMNEEKFRIMWEHIRKVTEQLRQLSARVEAIDQVLGQFTVDPLELAQIRNSIEQLSIGLKQQVLLNSHFANEIKTVGKALGSTQRGMKDFAESLGYRVAGR